MIENGSNSDGRKMWLLIGENVLRQRWNGFGIKRSFGI
jgi:hypothetical protein